MRINYSYTDKNSIFFRYGILSYRVEIDLKKKYALYFIENARKNIIIKCEYINITWKYNI